MVNIVMIRKEGIYMSLAHFVFYHINLSFLYLVFSCVNCIATQLLVQKIVLQMRNLLYHVLNHLKPCYEKVSPKNRFLLLGSAFDVFYEDSIAEIPCNIVYNNSFIVEKYITHFVDFCPSLEPGILLHV